MGRTPLKDQWCSSDGRNAHLIKAPQLIFRRGLGKSVTTEEYEQYEAELRVFRDWFDQNVMTTNGESLSDAIMIMPYGSAKPKYRDSPNE